MKQSKQNRIKLLLLILLGVAVCVFIYAMLNAKQAPTDTTQPLTMQEEADPQDQLMEEAIVPTYQEFTGMVQGIFDPEGMDVRYITILAEIPTQDSKDAEEPMMEEKTFIVVVDDQTMLINDTNKDDIVPGDYAYVRISQSIYEAQENEAAIEFGVSR